MLDKAQPSNKFSFFMIEKQKRRGVPLTAAPLAHENNSQSKGNLGQRGLKGRHIA